MQRLKVVILAIIAVCASSALVSATTTFAADPEALPTAAEAYKGESGSGTLRTLGGKTIECKLALAEGTFTGRTGTLHGDLKECKGEGGLVTCTGLGEASGVILTLGTGLLVYDSLSPLGVAILGKGEPVHLACSIVLVEIKGEGLCLITPVGTASKHFQTVCEMTSATSGDPKETKYWEGGVEHNLGLSALLVSFNHGTFEGFAGLGTGLALTTNNITIDG
jgi:hypothetical protein